MMKYAEVFFRPPKFVVFSAAKKCGWKLRKKANWMNGWSELTGELAVIE